MDCDPSLKTVQEGETSLEDAGPRDAGSGGCLCLGCLVLLVPVDCKPTAHVGKD